MPVLASIGLGGALVHQRSTLSRERSFLARERSLRKDIETRLAARLEGPSPAAPLPEPPDHAPEPPAASSYPALTARFLASLDRPAAASRDQDEPGPIAPAGNPEAIPVPAPPLRPHDLDRVRDL